ncbi:MAG TPA: tail fiber protein [Polyangiaceae bacterium]
MDPFVGEIRVFPFDYAPRGWAQCNGQLMPITQNQALFAVIGTTYGGDGRTTFGLPSLQGRVPLGTGQGPGLTNRALGATGGSPTVTLVGTQLPMHTHAVAVVSTEVSAQATNVPGETTVFGKAEQKTGANVYVSVGSPPPTAVAMSQAAISPTGGSQPHNNMQPYLPLNFCIAIQGVYPARP